MAASNIQFRPCDCDDFQFQDSTAGDIETDFRGMEEGCFECLFHGPFRAEARAEELEILDLANPRLGVHEDSGPARVDEYYEIWSW